MAKQIRKFLYWNYKQIMKKEIKNNEVFCSSQDTLLNKFIPQAWQIQLMQIFIECHKRKFHFILVKTIKLINPWVFLKKIK